MRRPCTEYEKEVLYKNRGDIISGTFAGKHGNGVAPFVIGFILGIIAGVPVAFMVKTTNQHSIKLILLGCIAVMIAIVQGIFKIIGTTRDKNNVFKDNYVEINGGTILGVNYKENYFIYVEDDFVDEYGRLHRITFPLSNVSKLKNGARIIAVRTGNGMYCLMCVNDETKNIIPAYSSVNLFDSNAVNLLSPNVIPHPNAVYMDKEPYQLIHGDKEIFLQKYKSFNPKGMKISVILMGIYFFFIFAVICALLIYCKVVTEISYIILLICAFVSVIIVLTLLFRKRVIKNIKKRIDETTSVQKVLLASYTNESVGYTYQTSMNVYEYVDGRIVLNTYKYPQYNEKNTYGTLLYKIVSGKLTYFYSVK